MKRYFSFFLFLICLPIVAQVTELKIKFDLPTQVEESSGLLLVDGKIVTHNDSGDNANLYELDSVSGNILRTVNISNATNVDWEDITEDDTHIFVADIGNNNGNRTNLTIYKILKSDFANDTSITAEEITFAYEDQTDFSSRPNNNNFDAEAIVIYGDDILIFTKNWTNLQTNVYKIPKGKGNYTATKVSTANVECLITGATYHDDRFFLTAYNSTDPFTIYISFNRMPGDDIFASGFTKISMADRIEQASQIEGITAFGIASPKYYLSREKFTFTQNGMTFTFPARLYEFTDETAPLLSVKSFESFAINVSPNPVSTHFSVNSDKNISGFEIYNMLGKRVLAGAYQDKNIDISKLPKGMYLAKFYFEAKKSTVKKIIKL